MSPFEVAAGVLLLALVGPALLLSARGTAAQRLVGLQLATALTVLLLTVLSVAFGQTSMLIVPLVLVLLAFAGTLVFTRLLRRRS
ncbi:monovalent cation/H+ antiporter complex subunit F [Actinomycetospora chiangmaiensis]|uniref:monovalent cation/H+ antiporter complex subunit F n=1 Tax=Actinomycetospora chiangmaiensis TaxID=402650 RepID=UPI00036255C7|nr:monovalent cation/H+ antiporter complex subunit F [Actinomycetospora chiangmaiensis]